MIHSPPDHSVALWPRKAILIPGPTNPVRYLNPVFSDFSRYPSLRVANFSSDSSAQVFLRHSEAAQSPITKTTIQNFFMDSPFLWIPPDFLAFSGSNISSGDLSSTLGFSGSQWGESASRYAMMRRGRP